MFAIAGVNVAEIVLAKNVFSAGDFGYGLLVAAGAVGLVLGSLFGGSWIEQRGMAVPYGDLHRSDGAQLRRGGRRAERLGRRGRGRGRRGGERRRG